MAGHDITWECCTQEGCTGVRLPGEDRCWVHADERVRDLAAKRLGQDGNLDARGVSFAGTVLNDLLAAAATDEGYTILQSVDFAAAVFRDAKFDKVIFQRKAGFQGAVFHGETAFLNMDFGNVADFTGATFDGDVMLELIEFNLRAEFNQAAFQGETRLEGVTFHGEADFTGATFDGDATLELVAFKGQAGFNQAAFHGQTWLGGVVFHDQADFGGAAFDRPARFGGTSFHCAAVFDNATFLGGADFGETDMAEAPWAYQDGAGPWAAAVFRDVAFFRRTKFDGDGRFTAATFDGGASFAHAVFHGGAEFGSAKFTGVIDPIAENGTSADFAGSVFKGAASFHGTDFSDAAVFDGVTFHDQADFMFGGFGADARFRSATFGGQAYFGPATFGGDASFADAVFRGDTSFGEITVGRDAIFTGASFEQARDIGPLLAGHELVLDRARFDQPVRIAASTPGLVCRQAQFHAGVQFRLRWASVILDDTDFAGPSTLTGIPRLTERPLAEAEQRNAHDWHAKRARELADYQDTSNRHPDRVRQVSDRPWLLSMQRANVAGLGLSRVDLADCRFAGAHNLDKLRLEANVTFALAPSRPAWDQRLVIAEERTWRCQHGQHRWTAPPWPRWPDEQPAELHAGEIGGIYRALRKGREDNSDEPGAADFYYGEMEMRRHARGKSSHRTTQGYCQRKSRGRAEHSILTAYWMVSGYGLRAWRAFAFLTAIIAGFAAAFQLVGFTYPPEPATYWTSLLYAFRATVSLTDDQVTLTAWGELLQALLRLTGPVLLGLALLALRGRVKR
jgi:uncharacterized protein YjbI with pentapeptide repeats